MSQTPRPIWPPPRRADDPARYRRRHAPLPVLRMRVRCQNQLHQITWRNGTLGFSHHRTRDLLFGTALESPCRCSEILIAVRTKDLDAPGLPSSLRQALRNQIQIRKGLGHAPTSPRAWWDMDRGRWGRRAARALGDPLKHQLATVGLAVDVYCQYYTSPSAGTPRLVIEVVCTQRPGWRLASRPIPGTWQIQTAGVEKVARMIGSTGRAGRTWGHTIFCHTCKRIEEPHRFPDRRLMAAHAETPTHLAGVRAAFDRVLGPTALWTASLK